MKSGMLFRRIKNPTSMDESSYNHSTNIVKSHLKDLSAVSWYMIIHR